jgi:ElaB/YqjD/DUF883 family membrane-anchored ribosome-binding protein
MADLSKLNETITELEKQAEELKGNNKILSEVSKLSASIEKGVNELSVGNRNFDDVKGNIRTALESFNSEVVNIGKQNEKQIESLIDSNKKFLRSFEDTVSSKLERFSSDIQVTIRQERTGLQEALQNNITNQFNGLEGKQKDLFEKQAKEINLLKTLLFVVITISVVGVIAIFVK